MAEHPHHLAARVVEELARRGYTIATAESSIGGLVCHLLAQVPGASRVLAGGIVAYANAAKVDLLDVDPATIEDAGAVSEATALAMARGARAAFHADIAVAETGIAGTPTTEDTRTDRPIGLYYVACVTKDAQRVQHHVFPGDRLATMHAAAGAALHLVLDTLDPLDSPEER